MPAFFLIATTQQKGRRPHEQTGCPKTHLF